jgi:hypothetical protein
LGTAYQKAILSQPENQSVLLVVESNHGSCSELADFPRLFLFFCTGLIRKSISLKDVHSKPLMEADDVSPWKWHTISAHLRAQRDLESGRQQRVCTSAG